MTLKHTHIPLLNSNRKKNCKNDTISFVIIQHTQSINLHTPNILFLRIALTLFKKEGILLLSTSFLPSKIKLLVCSLFFLTLPIFASCLFKSHQFFIFIIITSCALKKDSSKSNSLMMNPLCVKEIIVLHSCESERNFPPYS